jgi:acyl carrier protein
VTLVDEIAAFFKEMRGLPASDVPNENDRLISGGVLDSLALVELVSFLEGRFGISIDEDDLVPEHFETMAAIAALVEAKRQR